MSLRLETRSVGDVVVAVLVRRALHQRRVGAAAALVGECRPVAVIFKQNNHLRAFSPNGDPLRPEQVRSLAPQLYASFAAA